MSRGRAAHTRMWLQEKTVTVDSVGQEVESWTDTVKVSARRKEERGGERISANRVDSEQAVVWDGIRTSENVSEDWRIRTGGTEQNPTGVQNIRSVVISRLRPKEFEIQTVKE